MPPGGGVPDDFAASIEHLQGSNLLAVAMVQSLYYALAGLGIIPADRLADALDQMLLQLEQIAAMPGHEMPVAVLSARQRLETFLEAFRKETGDRIRD